MRQLARASNGEVKAELPRAEWPMMVRFRDINDPMNVEQVAPKAAGVRRIVVETTRDPVTTGIMNRLGWLKEAESFHFHGKAYGDIYSLPSNYFRSVAR